MKRGKRYQEALKCLEPGKVYSLQEAIATLKKYPKPKFDETVEISFKLGVNPEAPGQMVRGTVGLPHGSGKKVRVIVFAKGEVARLAELAGADAVGAEELIAKVEQGWADFDVAVAHPELMRELAKLGRVLGPKGLMPNPKTGTVTPDVAKAVKELKAGRLEFKTDKQAGIHVGVGKISFDEESLIANARAVIDAVTAARPAAAKGIYLESVALATTMGPGVELDAGPWREQA
ncbi:MAG: 50S ribosomal protein L1 [Candidatus Omnitrophica bacterium]|nr:50S ribosomal protein L1 [Candidatus Omnitrophota bacterium]